MALIINESFKNNFNGIFCLKIADITNRKQNARTKLKFSWKTFIFFIVPLLLLLTLSLTNPKNSSEGRLYIIIVITNGKKI